MNAIQSTDTFQRSRRLPKWDQTGQKWQSEHSASPQQGKVTPKPTEPQAKTLTINATEPKKAEQKDLRGKQNEAVSFKRQVQHDTFNGKGVASATPKTAEKVRMVASAILGIGCVAVGVFTKNHII